MKKGALLIVIIILLLVTGLRLFLSFESKSFTPESYDVLREVKNLREVRSLLNVDHFVFGGKANVPSPVLSYFFVLFDKFFGITGFKLASALFALFVPLGVFLLVDRLTPSSRIAQSLSVLLSAFVPAFFSVTVYSISNLVIFLPLFVFALYFYISAKRSKSGAIWFLLMVFGLSLLTPLTIVFILGLILYLVIAKLEGVYVEKGEYERILFSCFLFIWVQFLLYKSALVKHGFLIFFQNIPSVLSSSFGSIGQNLFLMVGLLPLFVGGFAIYHILFNDRKPVKLLLVSMSLVTIVLLWLRLVPVGSGLAILAILFSILYAPAHVVVFDYIDKTKFVKAKVFLGGFVVFLVVFSVFLPSLLVLNQQRLATLSSYELEMYGWLKENAFRSANVLVAWSEADAFIYFTNLRSVLGSNFLFVDNVDGVFADTKKIISSNSEINAVELLNKYDVDYLAFTPRLQKFYGVGDLSFSVPCLKVISSDPIIYKNDCRLEVS